MADDDPLALSGDRFPPRRRSGTQQWQDAIEAQRQRDLAKPSTGEQIADIINHVIMGNPIMQAARLYQGIYQGQIDPLSPEAAGRGLWTALSMAGAGMPYAQRGAVGSAGGKLPPESLYKVPPRFLKQPRHPELEEAGLPELNQRRRILNKLLYEGDFVPIIDWDEGRLRFRSLTPEENIVMNRIGWSRAPDVTYEQETSPQTSREAWEKNVRYWHSLASPPEDRT